MPSHALQGRLLLVDDDPTVSEFMLDMLSEWGLDVHHVSNGIDGLKHFAEDPERYDLIILDQTMPKITGMQTAEQMLKLRPYVPIILYTGYGAQISPQQIKDTGIRALVKKPIDVQAFYRLLLQLLSH